MGQANPFLLLWGPFTSLGQAIRAFQGASLVSSNQVFGLSFTMFVSVWRHFFSVVCKYFWLQLTHYVKVFTIFAQIKINSNHHNAFGWNENKNMTDVLVEEEVETLSIIGIDIDGEYSIIDFINFQESLSNIYDFYFLKEALVKCLSTNNKVDTLKYLSYMTFLGDFTELQIEISKSSYISKYLTFELKKNLVFMPMAFMELRGHNKTLQIDKIRYSSPGFQDLIGFGKAIEHLKELIFKLIDLRISKEVRNQELRKLKIENDGLEIENQIKTIQKNDLLIELLKKNGLEKEVDSVLKFEILNSKRLVTLIDEKKIVNIT